jgi:hypothetical protein
VTAWTREYYTSGGDGGIDNFSFTASARYIRMYSSARTSQYGNSIYEFEVFGTLPSGIEDLYAPKSFSVYPNPATGNIVQISFIGDWAGEDAILSVSGISGQVICTEAVQVSGEKATGIMLPLNDPLKSGVYIVTVRGRNITRHTKLVVK